MCFTIQNNSNQRRRNPDAKMRIAYKVAIVLVRMFEKKSITSLTRNDAHLWLKVMP